MSFIGLGLIGLGTGGIKPCVSPFGGEQFKVPEQSSLIATYFSIFYASINAGSLISTILTPILRADVQCFGEDSCYPLAFGVPAILLVVAIGMFMKSKNLLANIRNLKLLAQLAKIVDRLISFHISAFFLCGRIFNLYKITMPEKNILVETAKCIWVSNNKINDLPFYLYY